MIEIETTFLRIERKSFSTTLTTKIQPTMKNSIAILANAADES